jgi:hypothetical protein
MVIAALLHRSTSGITAIPVHGFAGRRATLETLKPINSR